MRGFYYNVGVLIRILHNYNEMIVCIIEYAFTSCYQGLHCVNAVNHDVISMYKII